MSIRTVLFDLDGTLADTAPDLAQTLNTLLVEEGRTALPYAIIRPEVSHGATALLRLGFGDVDAGNSNACARAFSRSTPTTSCAIHASSRAWRNCSRN